MSPMKHVHDESPSWNRALGSPARQSSGSDWDGRRRSIGVTRRMGGVMVIPGAKADAARHLPTALEVLVLCVDAGSKAWARSQPSDSAAALGARIEIVTNHLALVRGMDDDKTAVSFAGYAPAAARPALARGVGSGRGFPDPSGSQAQPGSAEYQVGSAAPAGGAHDQSGGQNAASRLRRLRRGSVHGDVHLAGAARPLIR